MRRVLRAVVGFVVGDDPLVAVGVAGALVLAWAAVRVGVDAWWLLALAIPAVLAASLRRAAAR